jgi:hydrogenase maturation protease
VVGFGNPLRRDDGVGWRVAEELARRWGDRIEVLLGQQPVPEWAATLSEVNFAFLIDAAAGGRKNLSQPAGLAMRRVGLAGELQPSGHAFGVEELMALTQAVYGRAPEAWLVLLAAQDLNFGEDLSPSAARAARRAVRLLDQRLAGLL